MENALDKILKNINPENQVYVDLNLDIREQILYILSHHPKIKNQKQLAKELKKKDSEVSRILSGMHNLTLETIAKLTAILGHDIIMTDLKAKEKYFAQEYETYTRFKAFEFLLEESKKIRHTPKDKLVEFGFFPSKTQCLDSKMKWVNLIDDSGALTEHETTTHFEKWHR